MKLRALIGTLAGTALLVLVVFWAFSPDEVRRITTGSSFNYTKYGTRAFYDLLQRRGTQTERLGRIPIGWPDRGTVVAVRPVEQGGPALGALGSSSQGLRRWLEAGNVLIMFGAVPGFSGELGYTGTDVNTLVPGEAEPSTSFPGSEIQSLYYSPALNENESETLTVADPDLPFLSQPLTVSATVVPSRTVNSVGYSRDPFETFGEGALVRAGRSLGPLMMVQKVGEGRVVYSNLAQPAMNAWLDQHDNSVYATGLVESFRREDAPVYFYEVIHGNRRAGASLTALLFKTPGGNLVLGLILVAVLLGWPFAVEFRRDANAERAEREDRSAKKRRRTANFFRGSGDWEYAVMGLVQALRFTLSDKALEGDPLPLKEVAHRAEEVLGPEGADEELRLIGRAVEACRTGDFQGFTAGNVRRLSAAIDLLHRVKRR